MKVPATIVDLVARFRWRPDGRLDRWRFLGGSGDLKGDCDDFAVTAARIEAGSLWRFWVWIITFRAVLWYCTSPRGVPHMALWVRGRGWIDNQNPAWAATTPHRLRFPAIAPIAAIKLALGLLP